MIAGGRGRGAKMPCESCAVQFSVFKRKRVCCECERYYCSGCLRRGGGAMCAPCRVLSTRPLYRNTIAHLKVRDLQCFLQRQNVSTRGCVEKEELLNLCVVHVNGAAYRRRGARGAGAFSSLKGLTSNINDFLNNAFDLRSTAAPAPPPSPPPPCQTHNCFNASHVNRPPEAAAAPPQDSAPTRPLSERFTTTPGGERDIWVAAPAGGPREPLEPREPHEPHEPGAVVESADCFEIEDLDDSGWEFVTRPADPLPNDSDVLLSTTEGTALRRDSNQHDQPPTETRQSPDRQPADHRDLAPPGGPSAGSRHDAEPEEITTESQPRYARPTISSDYLTPGLSGAGLAGVGAGGLGRARAASELELRSSASTATDTGSLKDELEDRDFDSNPTTPRHVTLEQMKSSSELETLSVKQLKELLTRNRVEYRGCLERADLLDRARTLWRHHAAYRDEIDNLPIEECCKICMAAPLECVLLECGHIAACTACSKQLAECPICRQYVVRAVRFFRS